MKRFNVEVTKNSICLIFPSNKTDQFFEGSTLQLSQSNSVISPFSSFLHYIQLRNQLFRWLPDLWLLAEGTPPTKSWFSSHLWQYFLTSILGHSMHAGGATALASAGVPDDWICLHRRWSSDTYQLYILKNPSVLFAQFSSDSCWCSTTYCTPAL